MPPDQPRPEVKPTREHREAIDSCFGDSPGVTDWRQWFDSRVGPVKIKLAALLASRDAAAEERGRRLEREAVIRFLNAQPTGVSLPSCAQAIDSEVHLATPATAEVPALEQAPCQVCGGDGEEPICTRCGGSGKEPK